MYTKSPMLNMILICVHAGLLGIIVYKAQPQLETGQIVSAYIVISMLAVVFLGQNVAHLLRQKADEHRDRKHQLTAPGEVEQREAHERDERISSRKSMATIIAMIIVTTAAVALYAIGVGV